MKPFAETALAIVQAQAGDIDSAIAALPHLLGVPNGETAGISRQMRFGTCCAKTHVSKSFAPASERNSLSLASGLPHLSE